MCRAKQSHLVDVPPLLAQYQYCTCSSLVQHLNAWAGLVGGTDVVSTSQEVDLRSWILRGLVIASAIS